VFGWLWHGWRVDQFETSTINATPNTNPVIYLTHYKPITSSYPRLANVLPQRFKYLTYRLEDFSFQTGSSQNAGSNARIHAIMPHLSRLTHMKSLEFSLTGVNDADLLQMRSLVELRELRLSLEEHFSDAALARLLHELKSLETLGLEHSQVGDDGLAGIVGSNSLRDLDLLDTPITDAGLIHLTGLRQLRTLHLWRTKVTDAGMPRLAPLVQLRELGLGHTIITDSGLTNLAAMTELRRLDLDGTSITDEGLFYLARMTNMESMNLEGTQVTGLGLKHLKGMMALTSLRLSGTPLTDSAIEPLSALTSLRSLDVLRTHLTPEGIRQLRAALPQTSIMPYDDR